MDPIKAVLTFCATLFFVLSPLLQGGFGGFDPAQFPVPQDGPPAQPAGYAFAIWGVIYLWLLVSAGAGLFLRAKDAAWEETRLPLILSLAPGAAWIGVARLSPVWATALIIWMLVTALVALSRTPQRDRWLLQAPVALYAGWLTAATWVSVALVGAGYGIGPGETGWAVIALLGASGTGALVRTRAPEYGLALLWALVGVAVANAGQNTPVALLAGACALAAGALTWRRR
ncbi:hypothetical protein JT55_19295 [Rhodovulum sp. NI22]|nr:hypothetical protein JT55_19295 [Rhodovulum sp. NI22]